MEQKSVQKKVTKDMTIGDVVREFPSSIEVLMANGVHCVGCHVSYHETLEEGFKGHGMSDEDVSRVVKEINESIKADTTDPKLPLAFTQKAVDKVLGLMKQQKKEGHGLRIKIMPGGCSGFSYGFDFDKKADKDDEVIEQKGLKVFVDKETLSMMRGSKVDFVDSLQGSGFKITNPNAAGTCGCGQSFR